MKELNNFLKFILKSKLLVLGFIIYFLFNLSAISGNHFMDYFFFGSSVHHCCQGLDFYQVPNGMYAFIHGGDLSGKLPLGITQYSRDYLSNFNVYHPLLTILMGGFFILFNPNLAFHLWMVIKIFITLGLVYYIYKNFKGNKYLNLAIFIFLINFSQYNEIKISQYQFLFNVFLLLLLTNLAKNKDKLESGVLFFLTLVAKPIGLLWTPVLILKKEYFIAGLGIFLFGVSTLTFNFLGIGDYFTNNLIFHLLHPVATKGIDFLSLDALLRNGFGLSDQSVKYLKYLFLGLIYLLATNKKTNIIKLIFFLIVHFLFFYDLVFQYHFSALGPVLAISLLTLTEFQTKAARFLIILISLPTVFFILHVLGLGVYTHPLYGVDPTFAGWRTVSIFQLLPILILTIIVIIPELKQLMKKKYVLL